MHEPDGGNSRSHFEAGLRWTLLLAGICASVCVFAFEVIAGVGSFVRDNRIDGGTRDAMTATLLAACTGVIGFGLWRAHRYGRAGTEELERWALAGCPLLLLFALPALLVDGAWRSELVFLILVAAFGLTLERLLSTSFDALAGRPIAAVKRLLERAPARLRRAAPALVVAAAVVGYFLAIGRFTIASHLNLQTSTSDLGEFDNLFFNALNGHPWRAPAIDGDTADFSALKIHAEFLLYVLLPFYALSPEPEVLLLLQTAVIALTAVPVYLFAGRHLGRATAALFAVVYLLLPVVQRPNFYDFHFTPLGMFFVAWTLYFLDALSTAEEGKKTRRLDQVGFVLAFTLALLSREDIALGLALFSVIVVTRPGGARLGASMFAAAAAYFVVIKLVIGLHFGSNPFDQSYAALKPAPHLGFDGVVATLLTNPMFALRQVLADTPGKATYLLHMSAPLLFLWLRRPALVLAALPAAPFTLLATDRPPLWSSAFQYTYHWIPYILAASVLGLAGLGHRQGARRRIAATVALAVVAIISCSRLGILLGGDRILGGFVEKRVVVTGADRARLAELRSLIARIPPSASVAATELEGPHVSTRLDLFSLKKTLGSGPDFILLSRSLLPPERHAVLRALRSGQYGIEAEAGAFVLLRRGADASGVSALARSLRAPPRRHR